MIYVAAEDTALGRDADRLALSLGLPLLRDLASHCAIEDDALVLVLTARGLEVREATHPYTKGVRARLSPTGPRGRRDRLSRRQPLGRAVGARAHSVLDATAGLGHDAGLLIAMGYAVTAVERSPVLAALLRDAAERSEVRLEVIGGDARTVLAGLPTAPDAVYIDPMFPPKRKASALAKKSVRLIRRLVGDDPDAADLLSVARAHATQRVVVKRPTYADPLASDVSFTIKSKLVRLDVYVTGSL